MTGGSNLKKKSKFVIFVLSFIPGLSHLYLGVKERAMVFFTLFIGSILAVGGLCIVTNEDEFAIILLFALPIIWLVAFVDAILLNDRIKWGSINVDKESDEFVLTSDVLCFTEYNKKLITIALSIIPGAGHMYLGLLNRGLQLMSIFFFSAFLMGWLNMSLFLFILPVIWFYSLFDAYHLIDNENYESTQELPFLSWLLNKPKITGWALIILGCVVIFERIVFQFINWQLRNYIQTGIVALLLIAGGIKLLIGSKVELLEESEELCAKEE